jgi:hypothetical protein
MTRGFTAAALRTSETACERRLPPPESDVVYEKVVATLDADECLPHLLVRVQAATRDVAPSAAWKTITRAPTWYRRLVTGPVPIATASLLARSSHALTAYVLADERDVDELEKAVDVCLTAQ